MKKIVASIIAVILILFGIVIVVNNSGQVNNPQEGSVTQTQSSDSAEIKEFKITAKPFSFNPTTITVNQGDRVRIVLTNEQGTHDWNLDEYGASTKILQTGESDSVEFVATDKGEFEYYCSVSNHRQMGMVGKLIVN